MGGSLADVFSGTPSGGNGQPSFLQSLLQGTAKGAMQGAGKTMQNQGQPGQPGTTPVTPPVNPQAFRPTAAAPASAPQPAMPNQQPAFYGGRANQPF